MWVQNPIECCVCEKGYFWNTATCTCENGRYAGSITVDSVIRCDEIVEETKTIPTKSTSTKTILTKCTLTRFFPIFSSLVH